MHEYEKLMESKHISQPASTVTVNAAMKAGGHKKQSQGADSNQSYWRDFKKGDRSYNNDRSSLQWRQDESYSFDEADTDSWFEALVAANVISALDGKYGGKKKRKGEISASIVKLRGILLLHIKGIDSKML